MQILSDEHALAWCGAYGVTSNGTRLSTSVGYEGHAGRHIRVSIAVEASAVVGMAYVLAITETPDFDESKFPGALLWLRRWEIWSASIDNAGYALLTALRVASGHASPLDDTPGHVFGRGEFTDAHACMALPMLFQWDAHFVSATGQLIAFVSHEGYVDLICRDDRVYATLRDRLKDFDPEDLGVANSITDG